jgi:hypothetical protein
MNTVTLTRHATDGFTLSAMVRGQLISERYVGYTVAEAKGNFKAKWGIGRR